MRYRIEYNKKTVHQCETLKESIDKWLELASSREFRKEGGTLYQYDDYLNIGLGGTTLTNTSEDKNE